MEEIAVEVERESTDVDVCSRCRGVYLDFFDGDPAMIARGAPHLRGPSSALGADQSAHGLTGALKCVCKSELHLHRYWADGPDLYRCGGCGGAFLTARQFAVLAAFHVNEEEPTRFSRIIAFLLRRARKSS